jgi:hypothetical protein
MQQRNEDGTNYQTQTGENNTNFFGGEHHHYSSETAKRAGTPQNLPRSGVVEFVGRDQKLIDLHKQLQQ